MSTADFNSPDIRHIINHSPVAQLLRNESDIRKVLQIGRSDVKATMSHTNLLNGSPASVSNSGDQLLECSSDHIKILI